MPIIDSQLTSTGLSRDEQQKRDALIAELKSRGMEGELKRILSQDKKRRPFHTDSNGYVVRRDGKQFVPNSPEQHDFVEDRSRFVALISPRGGGKALALDTPILTLDGWKTMQDVHVGDFVFDLNGKPVMVCFESPIMYDHVCYDVVFSDGSVITADADHNWITHQSRYRNSLSSMVKPKDRKRIGNYFRNTPSLVTTEQIKDSLYFGKQHDHAIPICSPLQFPERDLPIDPYVLGFWLGDGACASGRLTISEPELVGILESKGLSLVKDKSKYSYIPKNSYPGRSITNGQFIRNESSLNGKLRSLGLLHNKHIPEIYLSGSFSQRLELARGLMDSDGSIFKNGKMEIAFKNEKLANDVHQLLLGLGIKVNLHVSEAKLYGKSCGLRHRMTFRTSLRIFNLERKWKRIKPHYRVETTRRYIVGVQERESVPVKCITVASGSHLYLAGKTLIATHNSAAGAQKAVKKIISGQSGAVINPVFEDFKTSTWPEFREWVPWDHVVKGHKYKANVGWEPHQPFVLAFDNGAVVYCKGLNNPESARGPNINWLWYDEARNDETGLAWQIAIASVRVGIDPQSWITTTPVGTYNWIHDFFIKDPDPELMAEFTAEAGDRQLSSTYFIPRDANKSNLDPGFYISLKKAYKPGTYLYMREVEGKFANEGGALGDRSWFEGHMLEAAPAKVLRRIRYWDLAASERKISKTKKNDPDKTVGTLMSKFEIEQTESGIQTKKTAFCIENQAGGFLEWSDIKDLILKTAIQDGAYVEIWLEQEPAAGGKNQVAEIKLFLKEQLGPAWKVEGDTPEGDKVMRANPWFAEAQDGMFYMVRGPWNDDLFRELDSFPEVPHDDHIDSVSGARKIIAPFRTWKKIVFLHLGSDFRETENEKAEIHEQNLAV